MNNKPHSEETKKKMSIANKNNLSGIENGKETRFKKGQIGFFRGKKRPDLSGSNNYGWTGGWQNNLPKCLDCEKQLKSYIAKRCRGCSGKARAGENHHNFKGGLSQTKEYKAHYDRLKQDRRRGAIGNHTITEWEALKMKYRFMCLCCKKYEPEIHLTRDHIIPLIKGGTNNISNIQPLCNSCNSAKYTRVFDYRLAFKKY